MPYLVRQLITNSWYLSGVVAKEEQTVTGSQLDEGLELLNFLLAMKTSDKQLIPYYTFDEFNATPGISSYFIENLIHVETLTFNNGSVRFSSQQVMMDSFWGDPRVDNINSLPVTWNFQRQNDGGTISFYFFPDQNYPIKFWGKYSFQTVTLDQDLRLIMEMDYINYLRYALSDYIAEQNQLDLSPNTNQKLIQFESQIKNKAPLDLTMNKISVFSKNNGVNYGDINIGKGYRPWSAR